MKKLILLFIPLLLCVILIACDTSSEETLNSSDDTVISGSEASDNVSSSDESDESATDASTGSPESTAELIEKTFEIPVTLNGIEELGKSGFSYDKNFSKLVTVIIEGEKGVVDTLTETDFSATIDLSSVAGSGDIQFLIQYSLPDGVAAKSLSDSTATVSITKVQAEVKPPVDPGAYLSNGIVISGTRGMEQFGGGAAAGEKAASRLNQFKEAVGEDVSVYVLPAPIASAFYAPEKYPNSIKNHQNCFNALRDALVNVKYVDTLSALGAHTTEDIYFRTDHHWQALGAYYAAQELARVANAPFDNLSTYTVQSSNGIVGSLYGFSNASVLKENPDTMTWYVPTREYTVTYYSRDGLSNPKTGLTLFSNSNGYTKFIHGDSYTTHIQTNVGNGRKMLIFKDSFGNALAPFVMSSFDEVYIADFRYFKLNAIEFIQEHGITDVCFSLAAFSVTGKSDYIIKLMNY